MTVSPNERKIGVVVGKQLIKDEIEIQELIIYNKDQNDKFQIEKMREFEYKDACPQFCFDK